MRYRHGNPKDRIGARKASVDDVPDSYIFGLGLAFSEGSAKYGRFNWRMAPVRFSVYDSAAQRHRAKLRAGQWCDPKTNIPHTFSMGACYAIIEDARMHGTLIDDRPPTNTAAMVAFVDEHCAEVGNNVRALFKKMKPKQFTIGDSPKRWHK